MARVRWTLMRSNGEIVGSGVRFKAVGSEDELVQRARRDAAGQARAGDRLTVAIDAHVVADEVIAPLEFAVVSREGHERRAG